MKPAPAGSAWCGPRRHLSTVFTPLRPRSGGDKPRPSAGGAGRNRIAAGAIPKVRPAIPPLPRPCPVAHPQAVLLVRLTLSRLGPPRTASLSSAACASVGRRSPPCVAGPVARLALSRRTPRAASRSAARSPYMSASAPGGCGSSASLRPRASRSRGFAPAPVRPPPCAGRGFLPAPLPTARLRRANPLCCIEYVLKIQPLNP